VLVVSDTDWSGMMLQKQHWAIRFAAEGLPVCYVNKTPQRPARLHDFTRLSGLLRGRGLSPGHIARSRPAPDGVEVVNLRLMPPTAPFDRWNRHVVTAFARRLARRWPRLCMLTYTPTPAMLHLLRTLDPWLSAYVCVHHLAGTPGIPMTVLDAERQLATEVDEVFCDARFLAEKWTAYLGRPVPRSLPGCDPDRFRTAWRGDELQRARVVGFFGSSFTELDLACYRAVVEAGYALRFIGPRSAAIAERFGRKVEWLPPVASEDLPAALRDIDILLLAYRNSERNRGVIPGKFFECLATGKPLLISPLPDMREYVDCVTIVRDPGEVVTALASLSQDRSSQAVARRFEIASSASWENRFEQLRSALARAAARSGRQG
jgi:glycosyltransferase involved in cell wall biosynthesis